MDGSARLREQIGAPLRERGYEVVSHASAAGLPPLIERIEPDLLVLDMGLPEVSSFEVCGELRATEVGRQTPIMLVAEKEPAQEVIARGLLCGADDFCVAPARLTELLARVRVQLRNKRDRDRLRRVRSERDSYRRAAIADPLTGIPNRRSVESAIGTAVTAMAPFAVLFLDIDHFKRVNDSLGHDAGDQVLKAVAGCLARSIRGTDQCGRFGGEEFVVVVNGVTPEVALSVAERHRRSIHGLAIPELGERHVSVSVGVACFDPSNPDGSESVLVRRADAALYEAKRRGRNQVVVAPAAEAAPLRVVSAPSMVKVSVAPLEKALLDKLATGLAGLPLLAEAATEALRLAGDARTDIGKIARLVDHDPPLAARFVAVASSAIYAGRAYKATTTQQALVRIGLATARDLLYQVVYERSGRDLPRYRSDVATSFRRSVRAALASRMLAAEVGHDYPYAYLAGLLHDIGEARIYRILAHLPDAPDDGTQLADLVARHHARAGAGFAEAWKLPSVIIDACASHHGDSARLSPHVRLVAAADAVVRLCDSGPPFAQPDIDRILAVGVRPERVKSIHDALSVTFGDIEPSPASQAAPPPPPAPAVAARAR